MAASAAKAKTKAKKKAPARGGSGGSDRSRRKPGAKPPAKSPVKTGAKSGVSSGGARPFADIPLDLPPVSAAERARAGEILWTLRARYPGATCALRYTTPHELLVATILSAQCTDERVNKTTPALFARFPTPAEYAAASAEAIEPLVRSCGFYRNKAKAIHSAMTDVARRFGGAVPDTMDDLLSLHGVARKTANVVLGNAFHKNMGFVVDTHIDRLSKRLGLAPGNATVAAVEKRLMALFPRDSWADLSHMLISHGRAACKARGGSCATDPLCKRFCANARAGKR